MLVRGGASHALLATLRGHRAGTDLQPPHKHSISHNLTDLKEDSCFLPDGGLAEAGLPGTWVRRSGGARLPAGGVLCAAAASWHCSAAAVAAADGEELRRSSSAALQSGEK